MLCDTLCQSLSRQYSVACAGAQVPATARWLLRPIVYAHNGVIVTGTLRNDLPASRDSFWGACRLAPPAARHATSIRFAVYLDRHVRILNHLELPS